ncbi:hypothetical protein LSTR_LSTR008269 [Laodelphax striatellus]|uniref:leucine--tRNA ligase n=1 Tax=Laodelphax striatellus TaxID=195883 RepID=A0A482XNE4_LAOST|nr:hypothetical protein LSTR_LSTR008269 [Laodelphax striatellus]
MSCCILSRKLHVFKQSTFSFSILRTYCSKSLGLWNNDLDESIKKKIEEHWKHKLKRFRYDPEDNKREKFYVLSMFPYPSGKLHIGHVRVYTISDSIARFHRMQGKNVFQPMGWDAFGLPAENAAIERGVSAESWTSDNIKTMKDQLMDLECSFDWDSELATCHPGYYKFTQDIFLRMYHAGLVYQKETLENWDPVDKTVLADGQFCENGRSWRSGAKVQKKPLRQWFIRSTKFAKSLYEGLDSPILENWRDITKVQKHWIGECNGTVIEFPISGSGDDNTLSVWTDKAEHIARSKFILLAPGSLLDRMYPGEMNRKLNIEATNPITGEKLPIYVAGKLDEEDTSAQPDCKLGIPDASVSDREYARLFGLTVDESSPLLADDLEERDRICARAASEGIGGHQVSSTLRDWLISRQRHWGTPIPIIHCQQCGSDSSRETDTMDTFVDSSWYYLRYTDPRNQEMAFNKESANKLVPVDIYVGGKEHAVLHLYYARFVSHFLHSIGWLKEKEPFKRMLV